MANKHWLTFITRFGNVKLQIYMIKKRNC